MHRFCFLFLLASLVIIQLGCSNGEDAATYPVTGEVTLDGEPLEGATVMLQPVGGGSFGYGITDANGLFVISTFEVGDGAIPGDHGIVVKLRTPAVDPDADDKQGESQQTPPVKKLPSRYGHVDTSRLSVTVTEDLEPLVLKLTSIE